MKDKILQLIAEKPKHYSMLIRKDALLAKWVDDNAITLSDHYPTRIYSAVNQVSMTCPSGKTKLLSRWNSPISYCGHASVCECNRLESAVKTSNTKLTVATEQKHITNEKRKTTMLNLHGVAYNSQREDIKHLWKKPKISKNAYDKLTDYDWLYNAYVIDQRSQVDIADELGVYYSTVGFYCVHHGFKLRRRSSYSLVELKIAEYITSLGEKVETSNWEILDGHEIDILVPNKKFAIEVNGLYWHSYNPSSNKPEIISRHLDKTVVAKSKGIDLFHVTDWEWENKQDIIKSMISTKLNLTPTRIFARKCEVKEVDSKTAKSFFVKNHLQGHVNSSIYLGLYHADELVMAISVGKNRFSAFEGMELHRLCSKIGVNVVGGASKLLNRLRTVTALPIISYCDRSKSSGAGYLSMGFKFVGFSNPGYFWTSGSHVFSRFKCQKKQLAKWLDTFDASKTEAQNMFDAGYRRFYDCGNFIFRLD